MKHPMGKISTGLWVLVVLATVILVPTNYAFAYLDPGTGSFIIQIVVAGLLGILLTIRMGWSYIVATFNRVTGRQPVPDEDQDDLMMDE